MINNIKKIVKLTNLFHNIIVHASDYRMQHRAPGKDSAPLYDLTKNDVYPYDIYSVNESKHYRLKDGSDNKAWNIIFKARNKPNARIKIFRAVPKLSPPIENINQKDWVTIDKSYAEMQGKKFKEYDILHKIVPASSLYTDGNSILEWGYHE